MLADDQPRILEAVSAMLADEFDVVGVATEGGQALDLARRIRPDVIVLDVDMPGLNGFQTLRGLNQAGSPAPVVFLSMHDSDEIIDEAFRCGGRGYVVKSRVRRDLASAIDQALLGRLFVPSLTSLFRLATGSMHAMQLHARREPFLDGLAALFDLALQRGDATCVISTGEIREGLGDRLRARGWNIGGLSGHKRYLAIDADEAVNRFMRDGHPDADRLAKMTAELDDYRLAVAEGAASRLTVFGNMVMSLSAAGHTEAMIELESLWNTLTQGLPFFTLCGYAASCFHERVPDLWGRVCAEHGALSPAGDR